MKAPQSLTLRAQAFGPLRKVEWTIPPGVSVVVGPNRAGKSTLLALPEFLRLTLVESPAEAVRRVMDGAAYLRHYGAPREEVCSVGVGNEVCEWGLELDIVSGALARYGAETLFVMGQRLMNRETGSMELHCKNGVWRSESVIPRALTERIRQYLGKAGASADDDVAQIIDREREQIFTHEEVFLGMYLAARLDGCYWYRTYRYEILHLLKFGSVQSDGTTLEPSGANAFPLLRNWRDRAATEARFEFVLETLREIFPHVGRLEFEQAGQTVTMSIQDRRWPDRLVPISRESTGFVTALLQLCAVASTDDGGLVTIDEPETSLHPHAIAVLTAAIARWAREHQLRVVFATQSQTVLDQFADEPERIFVIEPGQDVVPRCLTHLFEPDHLKQFSIGDLFAHLEFGSHRDMTKEPG